MRFVQTAKIISFALFGWCVDVDQKVKKKKLMCKYTIYQSLTISEFIVPKFAISQSEAKSTVLISTSFPGPLPWLGGGAG